MFSRSILLRSIFIALLLIAVSVPLAVFASPPDPDESIPVTGIPLGQGLYLLYGSDPELPTDDLEPLLGLIGNAKFVGLGEAVHTSGGYYEMKHRVFRYLVDNGFRAFGFETPWIGAEAVKEYVETCEGSAEDALDSMFTVWNSTEVRDLLEYMCEWNQDNPDDPVHFYGFDIQILGDQNTAPLIEFLEELDYDEIDEIVVGILACDGAETYYYPDYTFPRPIYEECQDALDAAWRLFDEEERKIVRATSEEELAWARIHVVTTQSWQEQIYFREIDHDRATAARDRGMAYVAAAIPEIRFPDDRVVLWAHNAHLMKDGTATSYGRQTMGQFLNEEFGRLYAPIAITSYEFFVEWPWLPACGGPYSWLGDNQVEDILFQTGEQTLLVDFEPAGADKSIFLPDTSYSIATYSMIPAEQFNGLIYLESSPAMDPLFDGETCP